MAEVPENNLIPQWRLQEIRNVADTVVARAAYCLVGRPAQIAGNELLKKFSHIRLCLNPRMKLGTAKTHIKTLENIKPEPEFHWLSISCFYSITIQFNGNIDTKDGWIATCRALVKELGRVIFFSDASEKRIENLTPSEKRRFLESFADEVVKKLPFTFNDARPRFTLAKLRDIVGNELEPHNGNTCAQQVMPFLQTLLWPYLGHDGR